MNATVEWDADMEQELRERVRYEYECAQARERNHKRLSADKLKEKYPELAQSSSGAHIGLDRFVCLSPREIASLTLTGELECTRQIWPPKLFKNAWCQFGSVGAVRAVHEPLAYFGVSPLNAMYVYSDDATYSRLRLDETWTKVNARAMPDKAVRYWVKIISTERLSMRQAWRIVFRLLKDRPL